MIERPLLELVNTKNSAVLLLAVLCCSSGLAMGDQKENVIRGQGVATRAKRDYTPVGIRAGAFKILPTLSSDYEWRDNIYSSQANSVEDLIFHVKPGLAVESDWKRHALAMLLNSDIQSYSSRDTEDKDVYTFAVAGQFDVLKNSFAHANFSYANQYEDRGQAASVFGDPSNGFIALQPTNYQLAQSQFGYEHKANRIRISVDNDISQYHYENGVAPVTFAVIENDKTRSRSRNETSLRIGYELSTSYEAFIQGSYNFIDYDSEFGADGLQRSSVGYRGTAGVTLDLTGKLIGDVYVGYLLQDYQDARLETVNALVAGVGLKWMPTGLTTVQSKIDRTVNETVQGLTSGILSTVMNVGVDHELLRNIILSLNAGYMTNEYQGGNNREENIYTFGFGAKYLMNRHFFFKTGFSTNSRSSNIANTNFDTNSIYLSVGSQL